MKRHSLICVSCKTEILLPQDLLQEVRKEMEIEFAACREKLLADMSALEEAVRTRKTEIRNAQVEIERQLTNKLIAEQRRMEVEFGRKTQVLTAALQALEGQLNERQQQWNNLRLKE